MTMRGLVLGGLAVSIAMGTITMVDTSAGKGSTVATQMTIVDQPAGSPGLFSDDRGSIAPNLYVDSSLPGGDVCAQGSVNQTGYAVFDPDIWYSDGSVCNGSIPESERRTYTFSFPSSDANGPCSVLLGTAPGLPCTITTDDLHKERIILDGLFASKARTTSVQMALFVPGDSQGFSLKIDGPAIIVLDTNPNIRTAVYSGTAKLYPIVNGSPSSTAATSSFTFPLQIRIQEVP